MNIDEEIEKMEQQKIDESWYEAWWWEITWFFSNMQSNWYSFLEGLINLWTWKKIIWNDRWYDHTFLHTMLRKKLSLMAKGWEEAHYVGSEYELETLKKLVQILDDIEKLEEESYTSYDMIDNKYQEFGILLFGINKLHKVDKEFDQGENISTTTNIQRFWD